MAVEFITVKQARAELGDKDFYRFCAWLRDKGYINLTQTGEASYTHEVFATKDQLNKFLSEKVGSVNRDIPINNLFGQTREYLKSAKGKRK